jgi:hypothetical protein
LTERKRYVYRLVVDYPPGSLEPGWEPEGWGQERKGLSFKRLMRQEDPFKWPRNSLCFSATTAKRRAELFREAGATVAIQRSEPVTWPEPKGGIEVTNGEGVRPGPVPIECDCGQAHQLPEAIATLIRELGPRMEVRTERGGWLVPRAWIAAHGLKERELPALAVCAGFWARHGMNTAAGRIARFMLGVVRIAPPGGAR